MCTSRVAIAVSPGRARVQLPPTPHSSPLFQSMGRGKSGPRKTNLHYLGGRGVCLRARHELSVYITTCVLVHFSYYIVVLDASISLCSSSILANTEAVILTLPQKLYSPYHQYHFCIFVDGGSDSDSLVDLRPDPSVAKKLRLSLC